MNFNLLFSAWDTYVCLGLKLLAGLAADFVLGLGHCFSAAH